MTTKEIIESRSEILEITSAQASALAAAGRRLASDKEFWGKQAEDADDDGDDADRTVIRVEPTSGAHGWRVTVVNAVGIVAVNDLQLLVRPKIPLPHFMHLFRAAPTAPRVGDDPAAGSSASELWDLVAASYVRSLERLFRSGLLADYSERDDDLPFMRGSLHPLPTATAYYQGRIAMSCRFDEFALDSPLNRVLKRAADEIARSPVLDADLRRRARRLLARFDDVSPMQRGDLMTSLDRRTRSYAVPISLARHVLRATGRAISHGDDTVWTFLLRTPGLVEEGIRSILRLGLSDIVAVDRDKKPLTKNVSLNPDLVFEGTATGDVKYSFLGADWKRPHLYQAVTFATGYRLNEAAVVGFSRTGVRPPDVPVGDVNVRSFVWLADDDVDAAAAAADLVDAVRDWLLPLVVAKTTPAA